VDNNFYKEHLISLTKKGMDGAQQIEQMMVDIRKNPVAEIDGSIVLYVYDYEASTRTNLMTQTVEAIDIPKSNVVIYQTIDGTKVAARPSGTEPKIKFYFSVKGELCCIEEAKNVEAALDTKVQRIIKEMKLT
jgi:phosphoglucomutase